MKLFLNAFVKLFLGLVIIGLLLFLPAGTWSYWNAWLFIALLFIPMTAAGTVLFLKSPELLKKRLNSKEKQGEQKKIVAFSAIIFIASFVVAALNFRYGWCRLPLWLIITASVIMLASYMLYAEVMRENAYLSRTVEVQENQKVIDTGLYGIVRHPMYSATILMYLAIPIVLGSVFSFLIFILYPILIVKRIKNEEEVLEKGLEGYSDYKKRVKYRLIPFIW